MNPNNLVEPAECTICGRLSQDTHACDCGEIVCPRESHFVIVDGVRYFSKCRKCKLQEIGYYDRNS